MHRNSGSHWIRPSAKVRLGLAVVMAALAMVMMPFGHVVAQQPAQAVGNRAPEVGPKWSSLSPSQHDALKPLEQDWSTIDTDRKQKWLEIAAQFPSMSVDERQRVQTRMTEWAKLTPEQRGAVRFQFKQAKELAPTNRQARWDAYQALPEDQKKELASRASTPASQAESARRIRALRAESASEPGVQSKSNVVVPADPGRTSKPVGPAVVQAPKGATTSLISNKPAPPAHQQEGLPKITASPSFVNPSTLLPQRGPQAAAVIVPGASSPKASVPASTTRP
jgi:hypothetical protein